MTGKELPDKKTYHIESDPIRSITTAGWVYPQYPRHIHKMGLAPELWVNTGILWSQGSCSSYPSRRYPKVFCYCWKSSSSSLVVPEFRPRSVRVWNCDSLYTSWCLQKPARNYDNTCLAARKMWLVIWWRISMSCLFSGVPQKIMDDYSCGTAIFFVSCWPCKWTTPARCWHRFRISVLPSF